MEKNEKIEEQCQAFFAEMGATDKGGVDQIVYGQGVFFSSKGICEIKSHLGLSDEFFETLFLTILELKSKLKKIEQLQIIEKNETGEIKNPAEWARFFAFLIEFIHENKKNSIETNVETGLIKITNIFKEEAALNKKSGR